MDKYEKNGGLEFINTWPDKDSFVVVSTWDTDGEGDMHGAAFFGCDAEEQANWFLEIVNKEV